MQLRFLLLGVLFFFLPSVNALEISEGTVLGSTDGSVNATMLLDVNVSGIIFGNGYITIEGLENSLLYNNSYYAYISEYTGDYNITKNGTYGIIQNSTITANKYVWSRYLYQFGDDFDRPNNSTVGNGWSQSGTVSINNNKLVIEANPSISPTDNSAYIPINNLTKYWEVTGNFSTTWSTGYLTSMNIEGGVSFNQGYNFYSYGSDSGLPQNLRENTTTKSEWTESLSSGTYYNFRWRRINDTSYYRMWTGTEPTTWDTTYTGMAQINSADPYLYLYARATGSSLDPVLRYENIQLKGNNYDGVTVLFQIDTNIDTNITYDVYDNDMNYILTTNKSSVQLFESGVYNFVINNTGYNSSLETINYTAGEEELILFNVIQGNLLNITFYNETTNLPLTGINVTWSVINGPDGYNGTTTSAGSGEINITAGLNEIIYSAPGYYERRYFVTVGADEYANLRLYLLSENIPNSEQLDYTVIDDNYAGVQNATVKLLRRYTENGAVVTRIVEMSKSDINGEGYLHVEKLTGDYQFMIEYLGNTVLTTDINTIKDSTTTLRIILREDVIDSIVFNEQITKSITYNSATRNFLLTYNDPNNVVRQICMRVDRILGSGFRTINSSCNSLSTGTISLGIGPENGSYVAYAFIDTNTAFSEHPFLTYSITLSAFEKNSFGIFLIIGLVTTMALAGMFLSRGNPVIVGTLFGVGLVVGSAFLGLAVFTYTTIILTIFGIGWVLFMTRRRGE